MKKRFHHFTLLPAILLIGSVAIGQNLTPLDLVQINSRLEPAVSQSMAAKGFNKIHDNEMDQWAFKIRSSPEEKPASIVVRSIDSDQKTKTVFRLFNPYHYQVFIQELLKSKYRFSGIQIINSKTYSVFEDKRTVFVTTEYKTADLQGFEIIIRAK